MTWNFFKTNWFSIALVLLVLGAILRSSNKLSLQNYFSNGSGGLAARTHDATNTTALGLGMEPSIHVAQPVEVDQATAAAFLKRFAPLAISERKKFGVPASVLLAAGFLNSNIGLGETAVGANNYFALPCSREWDGASAMLGEKCVRKYDTAWASWRDFSIFLTNQDWYGSLRQSAGKDWRKWIKGMNDGNVSNIANFGQKMAEVITFYHLEELDQS